MIATDTVLHYAAPALMFLGEIQITQHPPMEHFLEQLEDRLIIEAQLSHTTVTEQTRMQCAQELADAAKTNWRTK